MNKGMSSITEGVCSLLSVRIEYIISSSPSPFDLHDTTSLLKYYSNIISEVCFFVYFLKLKQLINYCIIINIIIIIIALNFFTLCIL